MRSSNTNGLLKMNSGLWKRFMVMGAVVTARKRAASAPEPFRCWCQTFSGTEKMLPSFHSNDVRLLGSSPTRVAPLPCRT